MAAKRDMLWLLVWRALRLRLQRVSVVFTALAVGATIVTRFPPCGLTSTAK